MNKQNEITSVASYLEIVNELNDNRNIRCYRGQSKQYENIQPSLMHNKYFQKNEDKMFNEFLMRDPNLFHDTENNFDRLALMQHHQLPTRLLDVTTNPLVALYFAVEGDNNSNEDGEVIPFMNYYSNYEVMKDLEYENKEYLFDYFDYNKFDRDLLNKSTFSDLIELESTLVRLDSKDKAGFIKSLNEFCRDKNVDLKEWYSFYKKIIMSSNYKSSEYTKFNNNIYAMRLYHEIRKDVYSFDKYINPLDFYLPRYVKPRIIDNRIKNQSGMFMFVPFVSGLDDEEDKFKSLLQIVDYRINILSCHNNDGERVRITIPSGCKSKIKEELDSIGISSSFIYPGPSSIAQEIYEKYSQ